MALRMWFRTFASSRFHTVPRSLAGTPGRTTRARRRFASLIEVGWVRLWGGSGLGGRRLRLPFALRGLASRDRGYAMLHSTVRSDGRNAGASDGVTLPGNRAVHLVDEEWRMP